MSTDDVKETSKEQFSCMRFRFCSKIKEIKKEVGAKKGAQTTKEVWKGNQQQRHHFIRESPLKF